MPCYHPIDAHRTPGGEIIFSNTTRYAWTEKLRLSCGQCIGCRLERSRQWATRCIHEATLHEKNCFITLTYDDEHLPGTNGIGNLHYPDFQKFLKRLRFHFKGTKISYYMAGEYGTSFGRPHFHACLFGIDFDDKTLWKRTSANSMLYRSKVLEALWPFGYSSIGDVTFESAAYVARYIMKKVTGEDSDKHYQYTDLATGEIIQLEKEFNRMSLKPGIGAGWLEKYHSDVYPHDYVEIRGAKSTPPRYYDKLIQKNDAYEWDEILDKRKKRAKLKPEEKTRDRLLVKEAVRKERIRKLQKELT